MTKILANLVSSLSNAHVAWPIYIGVTLEIAGVIWPQYNDQFSKVQKILLSYGVIAAANSLPSKDPTNPAKVPKPNEDPAAT